MCAMYSYEGDVAGSRNGKADTSMNMVLRPGEAIVWRWGQLDPVKYHGALMTVPTYMSAIGNGLWEYRPDFSRTKPGARGPRPSRTSPPAVMDWPPSTVRSARSSGPCAAPMSS